MGWITTPRQHWSGTDVHKLNQRDRLICKVESDEIQCLRVENANSKSVDCSILAATVIVELGLDETRGRLLDA